MLEYDYVFAQTSAAGRVFAGAEFAGLGIAGTHLRFRSTSPGRQGGSQRRSGDGRHVVHPKTIDIKAGETIRFVLVNKGQLLHEFNLGDAAMHAKHQQEMLKMQQRGMLTPTGMKEMDHGSMAGMDHGMMKHDDPNSVLVEPGKTAELTWTFTKATSLEFACNIPGHYQAGMVGKLTVSQ